MSVSHRRPAITTPYAGQGMAADINSRHKTQYLRYPNHSASPLGVELISVVKNRSSFGQQKKSQEDAYLDRYILAVKTAQNREHPGRFPKKNTGEVKSKVEEIEKRALRSPFKIRVDDEKSSPVNETDIDSTSNMSLGFVTPDNEVEIRFFDEEFSYQNQSGETECENHLPSSDSSFDSSRDLTSEETIKDPDSEEALDSESQPPRPSSNPFTLLDQTEDFPSKSADKPQKNDAKASNFLMQRNLLALGIGYIGASHFKDTILTPYVMPWIDFYGTYIFTSSDFLEISNLIQSSIQSNPANILNLSSEYSNVLPPSIQPNVIIDAISQSTIGDSKANPFTAVEKAMDLSAFMPSEAPLTFSNTTQTVAESASGWFNNLPKIDGSMALKVAIGITLVAGSIYVGSIAYKYIYPQVAETLPIEVELNYTEELLEEKPQSTLEWLTSKFWSTSNSVSKFFSELLSFLFFKHS